VCNNWAFQRDGKYSRLQHFRLIMDIFYYVKNLQLSHKNCSALHATIADETTA